MEEVTSLLVIILQLLLGILLGIAYVAVFVILVYGEFRSRIIDPIIDIYNDIKQLKRRIRIALYIRTRKKRRY